jgi:uncharacterized membrane protein YozB (DUF420 family)
VDPNVMYWSGAWLNMAVIVGIALFGIRQVRRREIAQHRRSMLSAATLVVLFVASYGIKLAMLGREQLDLWASSYVYVLRFHELCVAIMVVAGITTIYLAQRLRLLEAADGSQGAYEGPVRLARLQLHRRAGKSAFYAAIVGLMSAGVILYGMYARTGLL